MQMVKRKAEYKEGPEARENFERLATAVFKAPKKAAPRKRQPKETKITLRARKASRSQGN